MIIFIAKYDHRHGSDVRAFKTEGQARAWRAAIADEWWETEIGVNKPDDPETAANIYFDVMGERSKGEWFSIEETELE